MMRPPLGSCARITRKASRAQREGARDGDVHAACQVWRSMASRSAGGAPAPALLKSRSTRPKRATVSSKRCRTSASRATSATIGRIPSASAATPSRGSCRRPAITTSHPSPARASAALRRSRCRRRDDRDSAGAVRRCAGHASTVPCGGPPLQSAGRLDPGGRARQRSQVHRGVRMRGSSPHAGGAWAGRRRGLGRTQASEPEAGA